MKKYLGPSLKLTAVMIIICSVIYPVLIAGIVKFAPGGGGGEKLTVNGKVVGYANIGQKFTEDKYFWGRPSAVDYNAAGSGGSNKGPSNPAYLQQVRDRVDTFLAHNPTIRREQVPSEMVTASGSGLDPHISPAGAYVQVNRVASVRGIDAARVKKLVDQHVGWNPVGPQVIHVLKLNIALEALK